MSTFEETGTDSSKTDSSKTDSSKLLYLYGSKYKEWSFDMEYAILATPSIISEQLVKLADAQYHLCDKIVWDMFSGIGTDAIKLAEKAGRLICTEINRDTFVHLQRNADKFNRKNNMVIYQQDCLQYLEDHPNLAESVDIVYFDPPWGTTYRSGQEFDFHDIKLSDGKDVVQLAQQIQQQCHLIIKAPITGTTFNTIFSEDILRIYTFTQQKLMFLFISKKNQS